ncbi:MAG: fatty acid desaturase [Verrucomicrobiaceae bacterium]
MNNNFYPSPIIISESEARHRVSVGIEDEIGMLSQFSLRKRLFGLSVFILFWALGIMLTCTAMKTAQGISHYTFWVSGALLSAVAINAFVLHLHEGMHGTLFWSPFWNRWCSVILGSTALISFTAYKVLHLRHHRYLGDTRDPDDYHNYTKRNPLVWMMHYGRLLLGSSLYIFLIPIFAIRHGTRMDRRRIVEEYAVLFILLGAAFLLFSLKFLLFAWLIPLLIVGFMTNLRGLTQHGVTNPQDAFLASRSIQANPVVAFCLLHENFHLEHHLFPEVPSYHLAALHRLIWERIPRVVTGTSYSGFLARFVRASIRMDDSPIGLNVRSGHGAETSQ